MIQDDLLVSGYWERSFTTATEKNAAALHFPFKWLVSQRAVYSSDSGKHGIKKAVRKWLAVTRLILRYVGRSSPVRSDSGEPEKMKAYYEGVNDRMNFLQSG